MIFATAGASHVDLEFWAGVASLIFYVGLAYFAGPPLVKALSARQTSIIESLAKADVAREEAAKLRHKQEAERARLKTHAVELVEQGKRDAEILRKQLADYAREEVERIKARTSRELRFAQQSALADLYREAADRAFVGARGALREMIQEADQRRLIDQATHELERRFQEVA